MTSKLIGGSSPNPSEWKFPCLMIQPKTGQIVLGLKLSDAPMTSNDFEGVCLYPGLTSDKTGAFYPYWTAEQFEPARGKYVIEFDCEG